MKKIFRFLIAVALCGMALSTPPVLAQDRAPEPQGKFRRVARRVPGQYIVVLKDDIAGDRVKGIAADLARSYDGELGYIYRYTTKGFSIKMTETAAIALSKAPLVDYIEEDVETELLGIQFSPPAWGLDRVDQRDLPLNGVYFYNSSQTGGGVGVNVYVIDSGINYTHREFGGRAIAARDFVNDGRGGNDCFGHGTHVAGTIGGSTFGVAKRVTLRSVRIYDCSGDDGPGSGRLQAAIDWVTGNHIKPAVVNLSIEALGISTTLDNKLKQSIAAGVTYVVAAGNDGANAGNFSLSRVGEAIVVGATDINDIRAYFSRFGSTLDMFAPGVGIKSAWIGNDIEEQTLDGTSFAAPHVAGVAASYLALNPSAYPAAVSQALTDSATLNKVVDPGFNSPNRLVYTFFPAPNPIDDNRQFVRQHYLDFFLREPDQGGWDFWTGQITQCGTDAACIDRKRVDVSRAFFFAGEFQNRADVRASGLVVAPGANHPFDNRQFVRWCYRTYLQREPDQAGWDFWTNELQRDLANDAGQSGYNHLIRAFLVSIEYRVRFGQPDSPPPPPPPTSCDVFQEQNCYNNGGTWDPDTCSCSYEPPPCYYCYPPAAR